MSVDLSAATIALAYVFAGYGLLAAAGIVGRKAGSPVSAIGLAYMAGLAGTMLVAILLVCIGILVNPLTFALTSLIVGGAGFVLSLHRVAWRPRISLTLVHREKWAGERMLIALVALILVVAAVLGYEWARPTPLASGYDAWSIWARKATILFDYGRLPIGFLRAPSSAFIHPDYPLLVPVLESIWFRFVGSPDTQSLHVEFWLLLVASVSAAAYIARPVIRPVVLLPLVGFIAVVPTVVSQLMTLYADIPMALLLMLGVLSLGRWVAERRGSLLALATLFLAAAANTKNEGLTAAVVTLLAALLITIVKPHPGCRRSDLRALLVACGGFAIAIAPWRLWLAADGIGGDLPVGKGLDPAYVASRTGRFSPALTALFGQLTDQSAWNYVLPLAISLAFASVVVRNARRPAAFYMLAAVGAFLAILWAYMINPLPIEFYLLTSAGRSIDGVVFVACAALIHLTGLLLGPLTEMEAHSGREREALSSAMHQAHRSVL